MLKKIMTAALALVLSTGALTVVEAAQSSDARDNYCCRGGYCYNQNSDRSDRGDWNCGEYCCDGQRGCW